MTPDSIAALKAEFNTLEADFMNGNKKTLVLVDSLFWTLDDSVLGKAAVVRAEFPVMPK